MEHLLFSIYGLLLATPFAFLAGQMAKEKGRGFWPWFFTGMILPFMGYTIVFSLRPIIKKNEMEPVANENLFDHLFIGKINKKRAA